MPKKEETKLNLLEERGEEVEVIHAATGEREMGIKLGGNEYSPEEFRRVVDPNTGFPPGQDPDEELAKQGFDVAGKAEADLYPVPAEEVAIAVPAVDTPSPAVSTGEEVK